MKRFLITCNSPGEVSSWLRVTACELKKLGPCEITVALVPCPYASGCEKRVAQELEGVDSVWTPWESLQKMLWGRWDRSYAPPDKVIFLGGEPLHALLFGWQYQALTLAYAEHASWWWKYFDRVAWSREELKTGKIPGEFVAGNLMSDVPSLDSSQREEEGDCLMLFPGSRKLHLRATLDPFLLVATKISQQYPDLKLGLSLSPYVTAEDIKKILAKPFPLGFPRSGAIWDEEREGLILENGKRVELFTEPYRAMEAMTLGMVIPGTNNSEIAAFGKPYVLPLHTGVMVGGGGLFGLLDRLPLPKWWQEKRRQKKLDRYGLVSMPNKIKNEMLAPEVLLEGEDLEPLLTALRTLIESPSWSREVGDRLRDAVGGPGAGKKLAQEIWN